MDTVRIAIVESGAWGPNHARNLKAQPQRPRLVLARKQYPEVEVTNDADTVLERFLFLDV